MIKNENLFLLEYDPDAEAAKSKIAGQSGSNEVAQNEMKGELVNLVLIILITCYLSNPSRYFQTRQ